VIEKPMMDPPKTAVWNAVFIDRVASSAVLTFARVDALMPMYAVISEVKTPSTNVTAIQMFRVKPRTIATIGVTSRIARSWRERYARTPIDM